MPQQRHTEHSILQSYLLPPSPLPTLLPYNAFLQLVPTQHRSKPQLKLLYRDLQFQRNIDIDIVRRNIEQEVARSFVLKGQLARNVAMENRHATTVSSVKAAISSDRQPSRKRKRSSAIRENSKNSVNSSADDDDDDDDENESDSNTNKNHDRDGENEELTNQTDIAIDTTYNMSTLHPSHNEPFASNVPQSRHHPLVAGIQKYHTTRSFIAAISGATTSIQSEITDLESESSRLLAEVEDIVGSFSDLRYGRFTKPTDGRLRHDGTQVTMHDEIVSVLQRLQERIEEVNGQHGSDVGMANQVI